MTASITPFQLILVPPFLISLSFPLVIVPTQTKEPIIPLIRFQLSFMLPPETLLVRLPPLLINHNFKNQITMIMKLTIPSRVTTLSMAGKKENTSPGFVVEKYATKNQVSIAPHFQLTRGLILLSRNCQNGFTVKYLIC